MCIIIIIIHVATHICNLHLVQQYFLTIIILSPIYMYYYMYNNIIVH